MRFSIEERAARYQRRYTGPWLTANHQIGPVTVTARYRRQRRIAYAELDVAWHDFWTHAVVRGALLPLLRRMARWLP